MENGALQPCKVQNLQPQNASWLPGTEEDDVWVTATLQQNWPELDPSPSYIRNTTRIKAKGKEEEEEDPEWKEEECFGDSTVGMKGRRTCKM